MPRVQIEIETTGAAEAERIIRGVAKASDSIGASLKRVFEIATGINLANIFDSVVRGVIRTTTELVKLGLETQRQEQAFAKMTASLGVNGQALEAALERASRGIADISDVMTKAALGLQEGLQPQQLVSLMEVATSQSQLMGTTVVEAFNQITTAVLSQQERGLKTAGIYLDLTTVFADYAAKLGVTADRLTDYAKIQATVAAVEEKTRESRKALTTETLTNAQAVEKLQTAWTNAWEVVSKNFVDMAAGSVTWAAQIHASTVAAGDSIDAFIRRSQQTTIGSFIFGPQRAGASGTWELAPPGPLTGGPPTPALIKPPDAKEIQRAADALQAFRDKLEDLKIADQVVKQLANINQEVAKSAKDFPALAGAFAAIGAEMTKIVELRAATDQMLVTLANEQKAWEGAAAGMAAYHAQFAPLSQAVAGAFVELSKLEDAVGKSGDELARSNASWDVLKRGLDSLDPAMLAALTRYVELKQKSDDMKTSTDKLVTSLVLEQKILDTMAAAMKPVTEMWAGASKTIGMLYTDNQKLAASVGLTGEAATRASTAWALFGDRFDATDVAMRAAVDRAVDLKRSTDALARGNTLALALADISVQAKILGTDFDVMGARVSAVQRNFDAAAAAANGVMTPALIKAGAELRGALADQKLYKDIEAGFLSITDTFTKMADGLIAGTLEIGDAFANLGRNLLTNFVQIVLHQVFDPILKEAASFVAELVGLLTGRGGVALGGSLATAGVGLLAGGGGAAAGQWAEGATGLSEWTAAADLASSSGLQLSKTIDLVITGAQTLYTGITNIPTIFSAAADAWTAFNISLDVGASVLDSASAGWSSFVGGLGAGVSALSGVIAAVGDLYILYQSIVALQEGRLGAGIGGLAGLAVGGIAGGVIGSVVPGIGTLIGALIGAGIGGAAGGGLGSLFDQDEEIKQINLGRANQRTRTAQLALTETSGRIFGATGTEQFMASLQQPIIGTGASTGDVLKRMADLVKPGGTGITFEGGVQFTLPPELAERISTSLAAAGFTGAEFSSGRSGRVGSTTELIAATGGERQIQQGIEDWQVLLGGLDAVLKALPIMDVSGLGLTQSLLVAQAQETADAFMHISDALGVAREAMPDFIQAALSVASDEIPSALAALLETLRKGVVESATKALLAEPVKIASILDLPALAREGEEVADTFARMVTALSGLDDMMQELDVTMAGLRGELDVPGILAQNLARVTEAMDAANIALATTQDPEKMLAAAQEMNQLIELRYQLQREAEEALVALIRQQIGAMGGGLTALAQAAPVLRTLGIEVGGMTDALADVIDVLGDVGDAAGQLQTLGQVAAAFSAEVAEASPEAVLASTRALAQGLSATAATINALKDAQQRSAGLSQLLGILTTSYAEATAALKTHFDTLRELEDKRFEDLRTELQGAIDDSATIARAFFDRQRTALEDLLQASRQWAAAASKIRDQMRDLTIGQITPLNPADALGVALQDVAKARQQFLATPTAEGGEKLSQIVGQAIDAGTRVFSRPSPAFEQFFNDMLSILEETASISDVQVPPEKQLIGLLGDLNVTEGSALVKLGAITTATEAAQGFLAGTINTLDLDVLTEMGVLSKAQADTIIALGKPLSVAGLEALTELGPIGAGIAAISGDIAGLAPDDAATLAAIGTVTSEGKRAADELAIIKVEHLKTLDAIRAEEAEWNASLWYALGNVATQVVGTTAAVYAGTDASWATAVAVGGVWGAIGNLQNEITRTHNELVQVIGPETTLAEFETALNTELHNNLWQLGQDIHASLKTLVGDSIDRLLAQGGPQAIVDALDGLDNLDDIKANTRMTVGWLESLTRGTFKGEIPYRAFHGGTLNAPGGPALLERGEVVVPSSVSAATWFRQLGWAAAGPAGGAPSINIVIHEAKDAQDTARLVRRALDDYDRKWRDRGRA